MIGPNGIGKSTLLKIIMGHLEADAGTVEWGHQIFPGYFAQDHRELLADSTGTVESWLSSACPGQSVGWVRAQLARVLFSGDEVEKKVASLSGGEAARLIFARLAVDHPNVLILDEPTNHLDLEAIEALVKALKKYDGTLIFVAHDRWFVSQLASRILEITSERINDYPGTYEEYLANCGDDHLDADAATLRAKRQRKKGAATQDIKTTDANSKRAAKRKKDLTLRLEVVTAAVEKAEARVEAIDAAFCREGFFEQTAESKVRVMQQERTDLQTEIEKLMEEWQGIEDQLAE